MIDWGPPQNKKTGIGAGVLLFSSLLERNRIPPPPPDPFPDIDVEKEYELIKLKKCKLPRTMRDKIVLHIEQRTDKEKKHEKNT